MVHSLKRPLVTFAAAGVMALGSAATPAMAAVEQNGLVNVALVNTNVQVPVAVAANICNVQANVIATGNFVGNSLCRSAARSTATNNGGGGAGNTTQTGLINVALVGTNIQVPIGVAANVCNVQANVIAANNFLGNGTCRTITRATATA